MHFPLDFRFLVPGVGEERLRGLLLGALAAHGPPARVFSLMATLAKVVWWRLRRLQAAALRAAAGEASIEELWGEENIALHAVVALLECAWSAAPDGVVDRLRRRAAVGCGEQAGADGVGTIGEADASRGLGRAAGGQLGSGGSGIEARVEPQEPRPAVAAPDGTVQAVLCGMMLLWREACVSLKRLCATCHTLVRMSHREAVVDVARRVGVQACTGVCGPLAQGVGECAMALCASAIPLRSGETHGSAPVQETHEPAQSGGQRQEGQERQEQQEGQESQ